jgi:hypothetical protein
MQENRLPGERPDRHPAAGIWERTSPRFHRDRSRRDACPTLRPRSENDPVKGQARNLFIPDRGDSPGVTNALGRKQGLGVHSGAIGDGIADLMEAGIVDTGSASSICTRQATIAARLRWVFEESGDLPRCLRKCLHGDRRVAAPGQVRSGLPAGGSEIRTLGPPARKSGLRALSSHTTGGSPEMPARGDADRCLRYS